MKYYTPLKGDFATCLIVGDTWVGNGRIYIHVARMKPANRLKLGRLPKGGWDRERTKAWVGHSHVHGLAEDSPLFSALKSTEVSFTADGIIEAKETPWRYGDLALYDTGQNPAVWATEMLERVSPGTMYLTQCGKWLLDDETRPTVVAQVQDSPEWRWGVSKW